MNKRVFIINFLTLMLVCFSLYYLKTTNTLDYLASKKDVIVSSVISAGGQAGSSKTLQVATSTQVGFSATTTLKNISIQNTTPSVKNKSDVEIVTPGPLVVNNGNTINNYSAFVTVEGVIERTNYERQTNSIPGLVESSQLDSSAQMKANDILARQYFEHTSPDGKTVSDLVGEAGYSYVRVGENLALGDFGGEVDLLTAWMNSPGHRANILDSRFQDIGVGIAYGNYQGRYVLVAVQHFGRPRSTCPSVDDQLKSQVENLQSQIAILPTSLDTLKNTIDTMRANGEYVDNIVINAYNNSVTKYDSLISQADILRSKYNAEVTSFNACIAALQ